MANGIKGLLFGGSGAASAPGDIGLAVVRITTGLLMALGHGVGKVYNGEEFGLARGILEGTKGMGFPAPTFFAWCAALTELVGGFLIAAGLLTRPAALLLAFNMAVAAFVAHGDDPWYGGSPSKEMALLYLAPSIMLMLTGAGNLSLDAFIRGKAKKFKSSGESSGKH